MLTKEEYRELFEKTAKALSAFEKVLFITTSNRWSGEKDDVPKSTMLANELKNRLGERAQIIDATSLLIYPCEGNVSTSKGNSCGLKDALLNDSEKNPSGCHRCWASINHADDELYEVSRALLNSQAVVFFGSVRWGQMNSTYQKLIERLTWLENRHSTLGEDNILANIHAGLIITGHNWRGSEVLETQKQVFEFFGFMVDDDLCWNWQPLDDPKDESDSGYAQATEIFKKTFFKNTP